MHWVIQKNIFKTLNFNLLIDALERLEIKYSSIHIPNGTLELEPDINPVGKVYVCGAIKLKEISQNRKWIPGSFLNSNFSFDIWAAKLGSELLNYEVMYGKLCDIEIEHNSKFFIRPLEDNKAFDGMVIDKEILVSWRNDSAKNNLMNLDVIVSPLKEIYREYRVFVVKNKVITGSVYKVSGKPEISEYVEQAVIDYVYSIINTWIPCESVVIDVCLTDKGYKVIEFNNINSSGFYACNVPKYVAAIQRAYEK